MPWFDRLKKREEALPKELEGKSLEDVVGAFKKVGELEGKVTQLSNERTQEREAVQALNTQFQDIKAKLASVEANRNSPTPAAPEERANFIEDGDTAFNQRAKPIVDVALQSAVMTSKILAQQQLDNADMSSGGKSMDGRYFRAWDSEISDYAKRVSLPQMATPQAWINIYFLVKGRHSDEINDPEARKKKYNFVESATSSAAPPPPPSKTGVESLTDQEKHVADRMGVSYENYAKRKAQMQIFAY